MPTSRSSPTVLYLTSPSRCARVILTVATAELIVHRTPRVIMDAPVENGDLTWVAITATGQAYHTLF